MRISTTEIINNVCRVFAYGESDNYIFTVDLEDSDFCEIIINNYKVTTVREDGMNGYIAWSEIKNLTNFYPISYVKKEPCLMFSRCFGV